jgi:hypothetical protein
MKMLCDCTCALDFFFDTYLRFSLEKISLQPPHVLGERQHEHARAYVYACVRVSLFIELPLSECEISAGEFSTDDD